LLLLLRLLVGRYRRGAARPAVPGLTAG